MQRYWCGKTNNGGFVSEALGTKWADVCNDICELELNIEDKGISICLPKGLETYNQSKTASADIASGTVTIESRNIAFKIGNSIVTIRVEESTGNIKVEVS